MNFRAFRKTHFSQENFSAGWAIASVLFKRPSRKRAYRASVWSFQAMPGFAAEVAGFVVMIVFLAATQASIAQNFKWNVSTGDRFDVEYQLRSDTSTTYSKRNTVIESTTSVKMEWEVLKVDDDGDFSIQQVITALSLSVGNPAVPTQSISLNTDSRSKPSRESKKLLVQLQPLIGLKFIVTMSSAGEVRSVTIPDETKSVLQELPKPLAIQELFSEQGIKEQFAGAALVFPDRELVKGDQWESTGKFNNALGDFNRVREITFVGTTERSNGRIANFQFETTMNQDGVTNKGKEGRLISFSESGQTNFDMVAGYFVSSESSSTAKTETLYHEEKMETTAESSSKMVVNKK